MASSDVVDKKQARSKLALVFYLEEKETGVVIADSKIVKKRKGTVVKVGYPMDWNGPIEVGSQFDAIVVQFGFDKEFLDKVIVSDEGKEIPIKDKENFAGKRARSKVQERAELIAKQDAINKINENVMGHRPLFNSNGTPNLSEPNTSSNDDETAAAEAAAQLEQAQAAALEEARLQAEAAAEAAAQEQARAAALEEARLQAEAAAEAAAQEQARAAALEEARLQAAQAAAAQAAAAQGPIGFDFENFVEVAERAKVRLQRLPIESFPHLDCLVPAPNKLRLGESTVYLGAQMAVNVPWVVPKPQGAKRMRVPEDNPNAVFPKGLSDYLLSCLVPHKIMCHVSGSTMPACIFNAVRDFVNSRLDHRNKLQNKHFVEMISEYHRGMRKKFIAGTAEEQSPLVIAHYD